MAGVITHSTIVKGDTSEVFRLWADFEKFPEFMKHVESVTKANDSESHWVVRGPFGKTYEWDAKTTRLDEPTRIAWNSHNGDIKTSGQVTFHPLPKGETEVVVILKYVPPGGKLGRWLAERRVADMLHTDMRNFKKFAEGMYDRLPEGKRQPA